MMMTPSYPFSAVITASTILIICSLFNFVDALTVSEIPNGDRVHVNGHYWRDVSMPTWRGSSLSAGPSNQFMTDLAAASSWSALCAMDSDNDGYTNGEELGDPSCAWTSSSSSPARVKDITHPGLWSSVPLKSTFPSKSQSAFTGTCSVASSTVHTNQQERNAMRSTVRAPPNHQYIARASESINFAQPEVTDYSPYGGSANDIYAHDSASCPHLQAGLKMWHDAATWGGSVPAVGSDVTLPANSKVLIRACSVPFAGYAKITVPSTSELIIDDAPVHLRVKDLIVENGAKLLLGSAKCRIQNPVTIEFFGIKSDIPTYSNGIRGLDGSVVELWGAEQDRTWASLNGTAHAGSDVIVVQHGVEWSVGDEIVVVTSIFKDLQLGEDEHQNEVRRITAVDADKRTLRLDRPLVHKHYGGPEFQTEASLLSRSVLLRSDPDRVEKVFGGHSMVAGGNSAFRAVGIKSFEMGQRNVRGRYPFHFHFLLSDGGNRSCFIGNSVVNSQFRAYTIHATNYSLVKWNTLYNGTGYQFYQEDGNEFFNRYLFNFGARVHTISTPAEGAAQGGETRNSGPDLLVPADMTAGIFYAPNPHQTFIGNGASGGWTGYGIAVFDEPLGDSFDDPRWRHINPSRLPFIKFDSNTAHSTASTWFDSGAAPYLGGRLWIPDRTKPTELRYNSGRASRHHTRQTIYDGAPDGWLNVTNTRCSMVYKCVASWGNRVAIQNLETSSAETGLIVFGTSSVNVATFTGFDKNYAHDMQQTQRSQLRYYDVSVLIMASGIHFRNMISIPGRPGRVSCINDLVHSAIFVPDNMNYAKNFQFSSVDKQMVMSSEDVKTDAAYRMAIYDQYGNFDFKNRSKECNPLIIGSFINWWDVSHPSLPESENSWLEKSLGNLGPGRGMWISPQTPGREVVSIDVDMPGVTADPKLDIRVDRDTKDYTQADADRLFIGHVSQFAPHDNRKIRVARNGALTAGLSGTAWYWYINSTVGTPTSIKITPRQFVRGTYIVLAMNYPAGTTFTMYSKYRYGSPQQLFWKPVNSRNALLQSNGSAYYFDDRHLYFRVADMWMNQEVNFKSDSNGDGMSSFMYVVNGSAIPGRNYHWDIFIDADCPTKNADGRCVTPSQPDPPADMGPLPVTVCQNDADVNKQRALCPDLKCSPVGSGWDYEDCFEYRARGRCWKSGFCDCVCLPNCTSFAFYQNGPATGPDAFCARDYRKAICPTVNEKKPVKDFADQAMHNPFNLPCSVMAVDHRDKLGLSEHISTGGFAPCSLSAETDLAHRDSHNYATEGVCSSGYCVPRVGTYSGKQLIRDIFVTQLGVETANKQIGSAIAVAVVVNKTAFPSDFTITKVEAMYATSNSDNIITSELSRLTGSLTTWSVSTPNNLRPARNVTIRVSGQHTGATVQYQSELFVFSDFGSTTNRNPELIIDPTSTRDNLKMTITPMDWVESVTLRSCGSPLTGNTNAVVATRSGDDGVVFANAASALSSSSTNRCARVDIVMRSGLNLKFGITLPCMFANQGASCFVSRQFTGRKSSCLLSGTIRGNSWWATLELMVDALGAPKGIEPVRATIMKGSDSNCPGTDARCPRNLTQSNWNKFSFQGGMSNLQEASDIEVQLSNGAVETYHFDMSNLASHEAPIKCVSGSTNPDYDDSQANYIAGACLNIPGSNTANNLLYCQADAIPSEPTTIIATTSSPTTQAAASPTTQGAASPTTTVAAQPTSPGASATPAPTTQQQQQQPTSSPATTAVIGTSSPTSASTQAASPTTTAQAQQQTASPPGTGAATTTTTMLAMTTTTIEPKMIYRFIFKISALAIAIVEDILSKNTIAIRNALSADVAALLKISTASVSTRDDISVNTNSGEIVARLEIRKSDLNPAVNHDAPLLTQSSTSSASWLTTTLPIFKTNAPVGTDTTQVGINTVSAAAETSSTTSASPAAPEETNNIPMIAGIAGGVLLLLIIVIVVMKKRNGSSNGSGSFDGSTKSSSGRVVVEENHAASTNIYGGQQFAFGNAGEVSEVNLFNNNTNHYARNAAPMPTQNTNHYGNNAQQMRKVDSDLDMFSEGVNQYEL